MFVPLVLATLVAADAKADFSHVPDDAVIVARFDAAELYRSPAAVLVRHLLEKAGSSARKAFDRRFVPAPSTVSHVWIVARPAEGQPAGEPVFLVQTATAFDADAALANLMPEGERKKAGKRTYVSQPGRFALAILDDKTFVVGPDAPLAGYLQAPRTGASPVSAAWGQTPQAAAWVWWNNADLMKAALAKGDIREQAKPLVPVFRAKSGVVSLDLSRNLNEVTYELRLLYADEAAADAAEEAAKKGLVMAREQLREAIAKIEKETLAPAKPDEAAMRALKLFTGAYATGSLRSNDKLLTTLPLHRAGTSLGTSGSLMQVYGLLASIGIMSEHTAPAQSTTTNVIEPRPAPKPE